MSAVVCRQLSKRFGSTVALDDIDLEIKPGAPVALVGPNGAGKTTLLSALCGFLRPDSGEVQVLGENPGSARLSGKLSALPQDAQFDPRFALGRQMHFYAQLQGLSRAQATMEVSRVLDLVRVPAVAKSNAGELSHGMRKRVAIAQSLMGSPELVLLDEPTAGLDPENARAIRELIQQGAGKTTFVVSSHNLDELEKLCETVIHIDRGQLVDHVDVSPTSASGYLTLGVTQNWLVDVAEMLTHLPGVIDHSTSTQGNIVIRYDEGMHPAMDQHLLRALADAGLSYKHLIRGRTLEDTLYGS
ncbi:MAG: ABC transporter ATP-binding protein [Pseudomonadota bacterium]